MSHELCLDVFVTRRETKLLLYPVFVEVAKLSCLSKIPSQPIKRNRNSLPTMIFVVEALSVAVISGLKLTAWWLAFNWLAKY